MPGRTPRLKNPAAPGTMCPGLPTPASSGKLPLDGNGRSCRKWYQYNGCPFTLTTVNLMCLFWWFKEIYKHSHQRKWINYRWKKKQTSPKQMLNMIFNILKDGSTCSLGPQDKQNIMAFRMWISYNPYK